MMWRICLTLTQIKGKNAKEQILEKYQNKIMVIENVIINREPYNQSIVLLTNLIQFRWRIAQITAISLLTSL